MSRIAPSPRDARAITPARIAAARIAAAVLGAALAFGAVGGGVPGASAHDFLESTSPAADSVVAEQLSEVTLTFNEPPLTDLGAGIAVEVRDAGGTNVAGELSIVNSTLSVPVSPTATGRYTVLWQTVSSDGHPVSGEFAFDYEGPVAAPTGPATTPATTPDATTAPSPQATAAPAPTSMATPATPSAVATPSSGGGAQLPLVLVGVLGAVLVLGVLAAVIVVVRRRRPTA